MLQSQLKPLDELTEGPVCRLDLRHEFRVLQQFSLQFVFLAYR